MALALGGLLVTRGTPTDAVAAQFAPLVRTLQFSARVETLYRVEVGATVTGRVQEVLARVQQRVAIARALVLQPPLVLADEPTGNLDTASSDDVFALLRRIHEERGTSFVIVTRDLRLGQRCDRLVELIDGRIARDEAVRQVPPGWTA